MLYAAIINFLAPGISLFIGFTMYCLIYFFSNFFEAHKKMGKRKGQIKGLDWENLLKGIAKTVGHVNDLQ